MSGMLPVQIVYADFYVVDEMWPHFSTEHFHRAPHWYERQDVTLDG